jgi:hypothetical protein
LREQFAAGLAALDVFCVTGAAIANRNGEEFIAPIPLAPEARFRVISKTQANELLGLLMVQSDPIAVMRSPDKTYLQGPVGSPSRTGTKRSYAANDPRPVLSLNASI